MDAFDGEQSLTLVFLMRFHAPTPQYAGGDALTSLLKMHHSSHCFVGSLDFEVLVNKLKKKDIFKS